MTNEGPGTDHVMSGPMRGLKKTAPDGADRQTDKEKHGHGNSMTNLAKWGQVGENHNDCPPFLMTK